MLFQTSIYLSILKITASNFQKLLLKDSTIQRQHKLDFAEHNDKVPFVISWPICIGKFNNLHWKQSKFLLVLQHKAFAMMSRLLQPCPGSI